jgi:hypothetical protein
MKIIRFFEENTPLSWFITFLIVIGIFIISNLSFPGSGAKPGINLTRIYHIFSFFFLTGFLLISIIKTNHINKEKNLPGIKIW